MKKTIEKQKVFDKSLKLLAYLSRWKLTGYLIPILTYLLAQINLGFNQPKKTNNLQQLAETWKALMPPDGQEYFEIKEITEDTAFVEIHLTCPLRGTGEVHACYALMNYDRVLMKKVGGSLTVLESQSNSGKPFCQLAIRRIQDTTDDLTAAHLKV